MNNIYFIVNPQAKNGYCQKIWRKLEKILSELNITYLAFFTEFRGHAKELTESLAEKSGEKPILIVAVGGDGTMHEVVNGAVHFRNVKVSYIPCGSGNDFSRGFGVPKNPEQALLSLLQDYQGEPTIVDIGKITFENSQELYFINNMGAGLDALISRDVNKSKIKRILNRISLGKFVYVYFLLKNLFTYKCKAIEILVDGKTYTYDSAWFVTVSNQPYYGGGMKISPEASPFDGELNITVVHNLSRIKLLFVFITVFWGGHVSFKEVEMFRGKSIKIKSDVPVYAHADGEDIGSTPLMMNVIPKALPILINAVIEEKEEVG
ncbi:diacylglycerol kinase family lipid kinase [Bacillus sp. Bva_UNVM-123]|uniref:diacylglycerol/lipid kinase family protein n=1 Tax=Bacillus sp. Bva_UNVM-123 TaxID=2829798 RepID=UPI00391F99F1